MGRKKRQHPVEHAAQVYVNEHVPELRNAHLHIRMLDGPATAPRYAVAAERCTAGRCPYGVATNTRDSGRCPIADCPLRQAVRLLMSRQGEVVRATESGIHWQ